MCIRILLAVVLVFAACAALFAQPKIEITQGTSLKFGDVYNTEKMVRDVTVKNSGKDTLHIKNVKAQCGCTTTGLSEMKVPPNDSS